MKTIRKMNSPKQNALLHQRLDEVLDSECGSIILFDGNRVTDLHIGYCEKHLLKALRIFVDSALEYQKHLNFLISKKK